MRKLDAHIRIESEPARCNTLKSVIHTNCAYVLGLRHRSSLINHLPLIRKKRYWSNKRSIEDLLKYFYKSCFAECAVSRHVLGIFSEKNEGEHEEGEKIVKSVGEDITEAILTNRGDAIEIKL